jgi:hypothetical protein
MKRSLLRWGAVAVAALALSACGSDAKKSTSTTTAPMGGLGGLVPTTAIGSTAANRSQTASRLACSLLTPADIESVLTVPAGPPRENGAAPKQFPSGRSGSIGNCTYGAENNATVNLSLVAADQASDAVNDFVLAGGKNGEQLLVQQRNGRLVDGRFEIILSTEVDFEHDPPAGVDRRNQPAVDAFYEGAVTALLNKAKARLPN